jgi:hypothetical protein
LPPRLVRAHPPRRFRRQRGTTVDARRIAVVALVVAVLVLLLLLIV